MDSLPRLNNAVPNVVHHKAQGCLARVAGKVSTYIRESADMSITWAPRAVYYIINFWRAPPLSNKEFNQLKKKAAKGEVSWEEVEEQTYARKVRRLELCMLTNPQSEYAARNKKNVEWIKSRWSLS
jgi:hypothetical protein